jgi:AcrR family transcriptional regulator
MAAVARTAGVSRVTLYSHFPTREALLEAAVDRAIAHANGLVSELDLDQGPAPEALSRLLSSQWRTLHRYRSLYVVAASSLPLRALHTPLFGRIKALIARGQADGDFRTDLSMEWLVATVFGLMHQAARRGHCPSLARTPGWRRGHRDHAFGLDLPVAALGAPLPPERGPTNSPNVILPVVSCSRCLWCLSCWSSSSVVLSPQECP